MRQDWLDAAEGCLTRVRAIRGEEVSRDEARRMAEKGGTALMVIRSVLPNGRRHNPALDMEVANLCDAAIIAAAQVEARYTGQRESFMLTDGGIGSVDADGNLYDERPPQG